VCFCVSIRVGQGVSFLINVCSVLLYRCQTWDLRVKFCQSADDSLTSAAWYANGQKFVCGGTRGQFYVVVSHPLISMILLCATANSIAHLSCVVASVLGDCLTARYGNNTTVAACGLCVLIGCRWESSS